MKLKWRRYREWAFVERRSLAWGARAQASAKELLCRLYLPEPNKPGVSIEQYLAHIKSKHMKPHTADTSLEQHLAHIKNLWRTLEEEA